MDSRERWLQHLRDPRQGGRVRHSSLSLLRQRVYQIVAGYEDGNDADRLRHDPAFQLLADQPLGQPLSSQPTLSRWENAPSARELIGAHDGTLDAFVRLCGKQVRQRGENPARCRFHRRSHLRTATAELLQWRLQPAHVSPAVDLRAAYRLSTGRSVASWHCFQSCSHRASTPAHPASSAAGVSRSHLAFPVSVSNRGPTRRHQLSCSSRFDSLTLAGYERSLVPKCFPIAGYLSCPALSQICLASCLSSKIPTG